MLKIPQYEIVDWIYDQLDKKDYKFKNKENLQEEINKLDTKKVLDPWLSGDWENQKNKGKRPTGKSLKNRIDDENTDYIKEMKSEIASANEETIEDIKIDTGYEGDTQETLEPILEAKKEELAEAPITVEIEGEEFEIPSKFVAGRPRKEVSAEVRAASGEIFEEIVTAGAENNLEALRAIEIKNVPGSLRKFLERERKFTISAVEEELKEESV